MTLDPFEREAFEKWVRDTRGCPYSDFDRDASGRYIRMEVYLLWQGFEERAKWVARAKKMQRPAMTDEQVTELTEAFMHDTRASVIRLLQGVRRGEV
jgi:hypothetical protein